MAIASSLISFPIATTTSVMIPHFRPVSVFRELNIFVVHAKPFPIVLKTLTTMALAVYVTQGICFRTDSALA